MASSQASPGISCGAAEVPLDSIEVDPDVQSRVEGLDADHIAALKETPEDWPPCQVLERGRRYLLVAGFHRYAAAQELELETIAVEVIAPPEDGDLRGFNFATNARHGKPPSRADKNAECGRLLRLHPEWSDREVGRRSLLSQPTVARIRGELEASAQLSTPEVRVGRGGYTYSSERRPGELPPPGLGETALTLGARVFSGAERARQRQVTAYLRRLAVSLEDQGDLLENPEAAGEAVRLVLGDEQAGALAERLANAVETVVHTVGALGWELAD